MDCRSSSIIPFSPVPYFRHLDSGENTDMNSFINGFAVLFVLTSSVFMLSDRFLMPGAGAQSARPAPTPEITAAPDLASGTYNITTDEPVYFGSTKGYYAEPEAKGDYPGVVMIHEWWGLNGNVKAAAQRLASEGFKVLAVDLYDGEVAATPDRAQELAAGVDEAVAIENMQAAVSYLQDQGVTKVASWGWCFGGGQSLALSINGTPLNATVIYYGSLEADPLELSSIRWPVLGVFGDKDTVVPVSSVKKFRTMLDGLGVKNEIYIYHGMGHAFANPSNPGFAPKETEDAWKKTVLFLNKTLKSESA